MTSIKKALRRAVLNDNGVERVKSRHPWLFRGNLIQAPVCAPGDIIAFTDKRGMVLGWGLWSEGALCIRVLSFGSHEPDQMELLRSRVERALAVRKCWCAGEESFRWVHGEGDRLPGISADLYGDVLSLQLSVMGWYRHADEVAKVFRKAPPMIAAELIEKIEKPAFIAKMQVVGAYINFFVDKSVYTEQVLSAVLEQKESYGKSDMGAGKTVVIDYSSPNIAKPFHVGHLRSTVIGNAIYKIHEELGYHCEGINHLGDWGTQFGKLIVAYKKWGSKEAVEKDGIQELMRIYVKFHDEAEKHPELKMDDEARLWFVKMQEGDEEALTLWKWFYDISIKEFERVYEI